MYTVIYACLIVGGGLFSLWIRRFLCDRAYVSNFSSSARPCLTNICIQWYGSGNYVQLYAYGYLYNGVNFLSTYSGCSTGFFRGGTLMFMILRRNDKSAHRGVSAMGMSTGNVVCVGVLSLSPRIKAYSVTC